MLLISSQAACHRKLSSTWHLADLTVGSTSRTFRLVEQPLSFPHEITPDVHFRTYRNASEILETPDRNLHIPDIEDAACPVLSFFPSFRSHEHNGDQRQQHEHCHYHFRGRHSDVPTFRRDRYFHSWGGGKNRWIYERI